MGQVIDFDQLDDLRNRLRADRQSIVLTNGHFDILHVGHLRYLEQAALHGDRLIVGINDDATTTSRKGPRRPILPESERAELVAGLACVDYAVIFREETARRLVEMLRPDVYVKGGDYTIDPDGIGTLLPEARAVQTSGGRVEIIPVVPGQSTSAIEQRILTRWHVHGQDAP